MAHGQRWKTETSQFWPSAISQRQIETETSQFSSLKKNADGMNPVGVLSPLVREQEIRSAFLCELGRRRGERRVMRANPIGLALTLFSRHSSAWKA